MMPATTLVKGPHGLVELSTDRLDEIVNLFKSAAEIVINDSASGGADLSGDINNLHSTSRPVQVAH